MEPQEQIPENLLDLAQRKSFQELDIQEKQLVLANLTAEAFDALHEAAGATYQALQSDKALQPNPQIKKNLMQYFEQQNAQKVIPIQPWNREIKIWQAAAVLLLMTGLVWLLMPRKTVDTQVIVQHDTIRVEVPATVITPNITELTAVNPVIVPEKIPVKNPVRATNPQTKQSSPPNIGMRTWSASDMGKDKIRHSGKSMQEDSLLHKFSFARI